MKEKAQGNCSRCPFFNICAAYVLREKRGENWEKRFCSADFENCVHFEIRDRIKAFITREGERVKL